jgi:hypothetical protein
VSATTVERERPRARAESRLLPPSGAPVALAAHLERHGRLPALRGESAALLAAVERSGLRGRGGAGFPTHRKLRAVAAGRAPVVVANGVEGEPASHKDALLMRANPQLVLDGAITAAAAVGAKQIVIAVGRGAASARASMAAAIDERARAGGREQFELVAVPERFVAGEESALVNWLNGGPAKPTFVPPRPFERGVRGRPTLVQNVETLANLALIARAGAATGSASRYRRCSSGAISEPGCRPGRHSTRSSRTPACGRSAPRPAPARWRPFRTRAAASTRPPASRRTSRPRARASAVRAFSGCRRSPRRSRRSQLATTMPPMP